MGLIKYGLVGRLVCTIILLHLHPSAYVAIFFVVTYQKERGFNKISRIVKLKGNYNFHVHNALVIPLLSRYLCGRSGVRLWCECDNERKLKF